MLIKTITVGAYETNCYIVADEQTLECAVIDPGADASTILDYLEETHLRCRFVLLTHGHFDHTGAVSDVLAETDAVLMMHKSDVGVSVGGDFYRFVPPQDTKFWSSRPPVTRRAASACSAAKPPAARPCCFPATRFSATAAAGRTFPAAARTTCSVP